MTSLARVKGLTVEQRVWRFIRKQAAPVSCRELAQQFDYSLLRMGGVMRRLRDKGSVQTHGVNNQTRYTATDVKPEDFRGTAPGTLAVLRKNQVPTHKPYTRPRIPRGRPGIDLERAWRTPVDS